jgi:hypothetical protein
MAEAYEEELAPGRLDKCCGGSRVPQQRVAQRVPWNFFVKWLLFSTIFGSRRVACATLLIHYEGTERTLHKR